jgi:signal transduction histidine kinase
MASAEYSSNPRRWAAPTHNPPTLADNYSPDSSEISVAVLGLTGVIRTIGERRLLGVCMALIAVLVVVWALAAVFIEQVQFVLFAPTAKAGIEVVLACSSLFASLVLFLFPDQGSRSRLRWIATGFLMIGLGGALFGYATPLVASVSPNTSMYLSLVVRVGAGLMVTIGLLSPVPRSLPRSQIFAIIAMFISFTALIGMLSRHLPALVSGDSTESALLHNVSLMPDLTMWHWGLSLIPFLLFSAAAVGSLRHYPGHAYGAWLVVVLTVMAGAQLHIIFWPSAYSPDITTATLLRAGMMIVLVTGASLELRAIAQERTRLLTQEREYVQGLQDLVKLRADFTSMVAHELASPIAAIQQFAEIVALGELTPQQRKAVDAIGTELRSVDALIDDVQTISTLASVDFAVDCRTVSIAEIIALADSSAAVVADSHHVTFDSSESFKVVADPERIGQVLRNLISNASKYSAPGSSIEIRVGRESDRARIEVVDRGYGVHPEDLGSVFDKYRRGRFVDGRNIPGKGLGLYLSQGILRAHRSELQVQSNLGEGSVFWFTLAIAE